MASFKVGDIVRYADAWCEPEEKKYLHVVVEIGLLNPVKNTETRVKIQTINSKLTFPPVAVVDDFMLEQTGFNAEEFAS